MFNWMETQQKSFEDLKTTLLNDVVLKYPNYEHPFILEIDASRGAFGAVLSQECDGKRMPGAFGSRKTLASEQFYPAHKLEFSALRWAVCIKYRDYLHHSFVDVYTDSNPVAYILKKMDIDSVSQRLWAELAQFDFKIHYRSGKTNTAADSLLRMVEPNQPDPLVLKRWGKDVLADDHKPTDTSVNSICKYISKIPQEQGVKAPLGSHNDGFPTC